MATILAKPKMITKNGKPNAVVLDIREYKRLLKIVREEPDELTSVQKKAFLRARQNLEQGKTLTLHELERRLGFTH